MMSVFALHRLRVMCVIDLFAKINSDSSCFVSSIGDFRTVNTRAERNQLASIQYNIQNKFQLSSSEIKLVTGHTD
jgi:hypothetical protein